MIVDGHFPTAPKEQLGVYLDYLKENGIKAVIQPGGSIKDENVIKLCDEYGIAMVFTSTRHFRH